MEYIEGETLTDRVAKGPLPLKEVLSIATQAAEALKAAHAKGIVHRDIKTGNIMLTSDGVAKILDFGLAKTAASTKLTQMGSTLGTFAYMSPEQARGEEVDNRSDLWSLGVVIYEMISGRMPFAGDYEQAVVYAILNQDPEPLTALRTGVSIELETDRREVSSEARETPVSIGGGTDCRSGVPDSFHESHIGAAVRTPHYHVQANPANRCTEASGSGDGCSSQVRPRWDSYWHGSSSACSAGANRTRNLT